MDTYQIASRMDTLDASGIRKVFDLAAKMKDPINLSIGQPDFDVPDNLKQIAIDAITAGQNKYTQTQGIPELHAALAKSNAAEFGWADAADKPMLVTSGVSGGLLLAILATVNPGDEVILADPYFVMYTHLINLAGGAAVLVDTYPDFQLTAERLAPHITPRTRMVILNSPSNPTGAVMPAAELQAVADLCRAHKLLVLSDEIYNEFCYDGPFASFAPYYEDTLLLRGFSKSHAMTGWRVGWATGPAAIIEKMTMLQQYTFVCAPSMAQAAAAAAMETAIDHHVANFARRREMVFEALGDWGLVKPGGAFYAFVPAPGGNATEFVTRAIDNNVLVIPGSVFSAKDTHFRISFATAEDKLAQGLEILKRIR